MYISPSNEYPRYQGDIANSTPGWNYGDPIPEGWVEVAVSIQPEFDRSTEIAEEVFPTLVDGVMTQTWSIRPLTTEELEVVNAPATARQKLIALGLTNLEIDALSRGIV